MKKKMRILFVKKYIAGKLDGKLSERERKKENMINGWENWTECKNGGVFQELWIRGKTAKTY